MASRLSYLLWNSTPDDELLTVAETGELVRVDTIVEQTERMLEHERAAGLASRFFAEAWFVDRLGVTSKNTEMFPEWTAARVASYREEFDRVLEDLVAREGDIRELFDGKETFVDETLAQLYGVPAPASPDDPVVLDETRWGLLTSGAVMAANAPSNRTSPTVRGKFLYERLLCEETPPPPDDVDDVLPEDDPDAPPTTTREKLEQHRADPVCAACHALIDPMGLALENYDALGAFRDAENGLPIDASASFEGENFDGVADLATYLAQSERVTDCIAHNLLSYAIGLDVTEEDAETVRKLGKKLRRNDHSFKALTIELVSHPTFRYLAPQEQD